MQDNLTPEQRASVAWDDVLIALNSLAAANSVMLHAATTMNLFEAIDLVRRKYNELETAQQRYRAALAGAE